MKTTIKNNRRLFGGNENHSIAKELNTAYENGFRFMCEGNYRTLKTTDPWSGMPDTTSDIFGFTTKEEAEAFALTQKWVFNKDIHATVYEIPAHTMTWDEVREAEKAAEEAKKVKKLEREIARAEAEGMTLEEYRAEKKRIKTIKALKKEIEECKKELEALERKLARKETDLKELEG